jgi:hypothetical protein
MLEKIEALAPQPQKWPGPPGRLLHTIVHEGDDEAETEARQKEAQEKALAEHIAAHPEDAGSTVKDFFWVIRVILRPPKWRWESGRAVWDEPPTIAVEDEEPSLIWEDDAEPPATGAGVEELSPPRSEWKGDGRGNGGGDGG